MVSFQELVRVAKEVERMRSKLEKIKVLTSFIGSLDPEEAKTAVLLLTGRIFPEGDARELGVGFSTVSEVVEQLKTSRIAPLFSGSPSLWEVYHTLDKVSTVSGEGARNKKVNLLRGLFARLDAEELEYLLRIIFGEPRIGANVGIVLEALARVGGYSQEEIRRAYMLTGDIGELARRVVGGINIRDIKLELFRPVKPMLADMAYTPLEVLREHSGYTSAEYKYDGLRVQVHVKDGRIEVFSRRMNRITGFLPDVVEAVKANLKAESGVLDGEALGLVGDRPISFQDIARRFRRKNDFESFLKTLPLRVYFFDLLYLNGKMLIDESYSRRRSMLEEVLPPELLARQVYVETPEELERAFKEALDNGHEGLVCKHPGSNYEPGNRGRKWLKLKNAETVDCVVTAAEWGHGRRSGWLSDYYLAVRDERTGDFAVVGKTFKGLTDAEFQEMTRKLLALKVREEGWVVHVKPQIVVEVEYSEIQRSSRYPSGLALRFARIKRIRADKSPEDVTTLQELWRKYERQQKSKASPGL
ncbi:MAG: ATP-dependent DNA ligase [Infirmifilum sp.]